MLNIHFNIDHSRSLIDTTQKLHGIRGPKPRSACTAIASTAWCLVYDFKQGKNGGRIVHQMRAL